jgi:Trypsin-co-occurring domain 1
MADTDVIPVLLNDGTKVFVEVTRLGPALTPDSDTNVSIPGLPDFDQVWATISSIASTIGAKLSQAKAKKAVVEFGVEIGAEAGQLTALLVKGTGKANLKITLEWS